MINLISNLLDYVIESASANTLSNQTPRTHSIIKTEGRETFFQRGIGNTLTSGLYFVCHLHRQVLWVINQIDPFICEQGGNASLPCAVSCLAQGCSTLLLTRSISHIINAAPSQAHLLQFDGHL